MSGKSCCFFGNSKQLSYRERDNTFLLLREEIDKLVKAGYTEFVYSGNNDFESVARIAVTMHRIRNSNITTKYIPSALRSAKPNDEIEQLHKTYDEIIIPDIPYTVSQRNRYIVDNSDYCCFYVKSFAGNAYVAMLYAEKINKPLINLAGN